MIRAAFRGSIGWFAGCTVSLQSAAKRARSPMTSPHPASFMYRLVSSTTELGHRMPSLACRVLAYRETLPSGLCGSYVSLSGGQSEHIVGLLSHPLGWENLGRALDHDLPQSHPRGLIEGACEVGRIVADAFKSSLKDPTSYVLGLPLFVEGVVSSGRLIELAAADVALGNSLVLLVLFSRSY